MSAVHDRNAQLIEALVEVSELAKTEYESVIRQGGTEDQAWRAFLAVNKARTAVWTRFADRYVSDGHE